MNNAVKFREVFSQIICDIILTWCDNVNDFHNLWCNQFTNLVVNLNCANLWSFTAFIEASFFLNHKDVTKISNWSCGHGTVRCYYRNVNWSLLNVQLTNDNDVGIKLPKNRISELIWAFISHCSAKSLPIKFFDFFLSFMIRSNFLILCICILAGSYHSCQLICIFFTVFKKSASDSDFITS